MEFDDIMRAQVGKMPRVRFVWERDWLSGPNDYAAGLLWHRNFDAVPGEFIYRRRFLLRLTFRLRLDRWRSE